MVHFQFYRLRNKKPVITWNISHNVMPFQMIGKYFQSINIKCKEATVVDYTICAGCVDNIIIMQ